MIHDIKQLPNIDFERLALRVFRFQAQYNFLYLEYLKIIGCNPILVDKIEDIPFMPISFFKHHIIQTGGWSPVADFSSSGTTSNTTSHHYLKDQSWYWQNARKGFRQFYGAIQNYCVLALLPSYLERTGSSLVFMADDFIRQSKYKESGFFLNETQDLVERLEQYRQQNIPTLLIGVSFALLDLAEQHPMPLGKTIIMETGGMKGRRKEITREELHTQLKKAFQVEKIHSEYGMTELLSQAYSKGDGLFYPSATMRVLTREITDPFHIVHGTTGAISIIDLANIDTISFIATDDLGRIYDDLSFEMQGRLDASDMRGCNLMVI
ncbi:MAG TPA: acyl transferase [Saprospiraceae bacterium]|nr:acyl transferase [Saprospiraceae bacterium]